MEVSMKYGSHLPVMSKLLALTSGPVLEFGMGLMSTPFLHWLTSPFGRALVSYENDPAYYREFVQFQDVYHQICLVTGWDEAEIEQPWDIVLVDHAPAERRTTDIRRLAGWAKYLVIHDSYWKMDKHYHYKEIYPLFRWRYDYKPYPDRYMPMTTVLSNFIDLGDFRV